MPDKKKEKGKRQQEKHIKKGELKKMLNQTRVNNFSQVLFFFLFILSTTNKRN